MNHKNFLFKPIGIIHTEFNKKINIPIQPVFSKSKGTVELFPEFVKGVKDLDDFSHIILVYYFHKSKGFELLVRPYLDEIKRGVFATMAPKRPNPIGFSIVKLEKIEENILYLEGVDMLDKTPLLDIRPYIESFYPKEKIKHGWIKDKINKNHKSDNRF